MTAARVLFTGGARSGKSRAAEALLRELPVTYVATGPDGDDDPEWRARVAAHRALRPAHWTTVTTTDLVPVIAAATPRRPVLVDCLTLWLTSRMDHHDAWRHPATATARVRREIDALAAAVAECPGRVVLVTNEVGSGIVPADPGTRLFRDLLGTCNVAVGDVCDEVYLVAAGQALRLGPVTP